MTAKVLKTKWGTARIDNTTGYYYISTCKEGNHNKYLHRLIYEAYYKTIPEGYHVHHIDGNKLNNRIDNLELLSSGEHSSLHMSGENNPNWNKPVSEERKRKQSEAMTGRTPSDETRKKWSEQRVGENNPRAKYTLWDINRVHYDKSNMFQNNPSGKRPKRVFLAKYNKYRLPIGMFLDFTTPQLINELIEESI